MRDAQCILSAVVHPRPPGPPRLRGAITEPRGGNLCRWHDQLGRAGRVLRFDAFPLWQLRIQGMFTCELMMGDDGRIESRSTGL